jgi:hypothetical protein
MTNRGKRPGVAGQGQSPMTQTEHDQIESKYHRHTYEIVSLAEACTHGFRFAYCSICECVPTELVAKNR